MNMLNIIKFSEIDVCIGSKFRRYHIPSFIRQSDHPYLQKSAIQINAYLET